MLSFLFRTKVDPAIGPDGLTDFTREMRRQWKRRDEIQAKVYAEVEKRTGIDADLVQHLPYEFLTLALMLGVKLENNQD
jgi:hypothetical protein